MCREREGEASGMKRKNTSPMWQADSSMVDKGFLFLTHTLETTKTKKIIVMTWMDWLSPEILMWLYQKKETGCHYNSAETWNTCLYVSYIMVLGPSSQRFDTGIANFIATERHLGCGSCQSVCAYRQLCSSQSFSGLSLANFGPV